MEAGITHESAANAQAAAISTGLWAYLHRAWRRAVRFERRWSAAGPTVFAVVAVALLLYNHFQRQVTDLVFWLGLALIGSVFMWMLQNNHRQSRLDAVTGVANRQQLHEDLVHTLSSSGDRRTLVLVELDGLAAYRDRFGFEAGDDLLRRFARELTNVADQLGGKAYRMEGGQFSALLPTSGRRLGEIVMAISVSTDNDDDETPIYRPHGEVTLPDDAADADLALKIAGERLAAHKQRQRRSAKRQAQDALAAVLSARRPELGEHLRSVAFRVIAVGRLLGLTQGQLDDVVSAAKLQNIGLLTMPDEILDKPTSLSESESELIRGHSSAGAQIISSAPALASVATLVRSSCEHYDGSGYPDGLSGDAIPLGSRIVAVCVAFTALTSTRAHRAARTPDEALAVLRGGAGAQFDPQVVEALAEDLADEVSPSTADPLRV
jgi:HD-GYP domain-containing protein (c-di-GMP phosphodiesterase class II)